MRGEISHDSCSRLVPLSSPRDIATRAIGHIAEPPPEGGTSRPLRHASARLVSRNTNSRALNHRTPQTGVCRAPDIPARQLAPRVLADQPSDIATPSTCFRRQAHGPWFLCWKRRAFIAVRRGKLILLPAEHGRPRRWSRTGFSLWRGRTPARVAQLPPGRLRQKTARPCVFVGPVETDTMSPAVSAWVLGQPIAHSHNGPSLQFAARGRWL